MKTIIKKIFAVFTVSLISLHSFALNSLTTNKKHSIRQTSNSLIAAEQVLERVIGKDLSQRFHLSITSQLNSAREKFDPFEISVRNNKIFVKSVSATGLNRVVYHYLNEYHHGLQTCSGSSFDLPANLSSLELKHNSPYQFRYHFNVVTHGYSTAYWDWPR